jgi:hypothetical protein
MNQILEYIIIGIFVFILVHCFEGMNLLGIPIKLVIFAFVYVYLKS